MTETIPTFEAYVASLARLTPHVDPTMDTPETQQVRAAAESLSDDGTVPMWPNGDEGGPVWVSWRRLVDTIVNNWPTPEGARG